MENIFSDRISDVPRSFIREILKVTIDSSVISFAGGLPSRKLFPLKELQAAANKVFDEDGYDSLQYSTSEGDQELREWIADRYRRTKDLTVQADDILITSGSQQGLDLLGKTFVNEDDPVIIEEPGYLGAIQALSLCKPRFFPVPLSADGIGLDAFEQAVRKHPVKLFYCVPNFQNPSGISYSEENRQAIGKILKGKKTILVEDDPYSELRFLGRMQPSFRRIIPENTVLLGSFSKIVVPSFRIGWVAARKDILDKLIIAKQASDLHSNYFCQRVISRYLKENDIDAHIAVIRDVYGKQRDAMIQAIREFFPSEAGYTQPEGGMFLWVTLPRHLSAMDVFEKAIGQKVVFVPGDPFYVGKKNVNTMRLNFSCMDEETIREGIKRLGNVLKGLM
ncbi:MAG: PLP-dependent aminotransferase family protein [bacterium]|nr:PLP-dependent aminotransferase family protein [bacterium]